MISITRSQKNIADSLNQFIKNDCAENAHELIGHISDKLCNRDIQHSLIDYDRKLLNLIVRMGLTYCIGTYSLNHYCKFISDKDGYCSIVSNLTNGTLKFNQCNWVARYMNELLGSFNQILSMGQSLQKFKPLICVYSLDFDCKNYYDVLVEVHNHKLEELYDARN
jgi:hypothetical protein